MIPLFTQLVIV